MRLSELKTGEKGVIVKVLGHGGFRKRIVEMGFIKGKTVEVLLNAPLKDPIKYKVMGYEISLRRQEAGMIEILSEHEAKEQVTKPNYHPGMSEDIYPGEEELLCLILLPVHTNTLVTTAGLQWMLRKVILISKVIISV